MADGFIEEVDALKRAWEELGSTRPFWSVLTKDRYLPENITDSDKEFFYSSMFEMVDFLTPEFEHVGHSLTPGKDVRVLDFGCGLGRLSFGFASRGFETVGVDISNPHVEIAREWNDKKLKLDNVKFEIIEPGAPIPHGPFDFAFSVIVLQHNRPTIMKACIGRIIDALKPGGAAMLHIPYEIEGYDESILLTPPVSMEMHFLPIDEIIQLATEHGGSVVRIEGANRCGARIKNAHFYIEKNATH